MFQLPDCVVRGITRLDLSGNRKLSSLPAELELCASSLLYLMLNDTNMTSFPLVVTSCHQLIELHMKRCNLDTFPSDEAFSMTSRAGLAESSWPQLQLLDLSCNNLKSIPYTLGNTKEHLRTLALEGNGIKWLRSSVLSKGTSAVLQFLFDKIPR